MRVGRYIHVNICLIPADVDLVNCESNEQAWSNWVAGRTWIEDTVFRDSSATPLEVEPNGSLAVKNCTFRNIDRERIREMCMERAEDNFCELYPDGDFYVGE